MNTLKTLIGAAAIAAMMSAPANAAVFAKYDGVDGESRSAEDSDGAATAGASPMDLKRGTTTRNATNGSESNKGGNAETTWKVEKGEK